jgi:hypothetical protein
VACLTSGGVIRARLRDVTVEEVVVDGAAIQLVSVESSFAMEGPGFAWGFRYSRPVRVSSNRGSDSITDHVMWARLTVALTTFLVAIRRFTRG